MSVRSRAFLACVLAAVAFMVAFASPAAAAAPVKMNQEIAIPEFAFFDACTNEVFLGSGSIHLVLATAQTASGAKIDFHVNSRATGIGVVTGTPYTYIQTENDHLMVGTPFPLTVHAVSTLRIIGQGAARNFEFHIVARIAFDASGNLVMQDIKLTSTCGGQPFPA